MKEIYEKIYIKSEIDLPKIEDAYYVHLKPDNKVVEWFFHKDASHQEWLKYIDWYLRPVDAEQEKVTNEEINIEADKRYPSDKEGFPNPHGYSFASGAEWMRDKITHNK